MVGDAFQDDGELKEAFERARQADDFQNELPDRPNPDLPHVPDFVVTILKVLGYALIAVLVVVLIFAIYQFIRSWRLKRIEAEKAERDKKSIRIRAQDMEVDEGALKELVEAGRFSEAIHLLLLQTLQSLGRALELKLDPSWTSREILERIRLQDQAHDSLSALVQSVELSHFGGVEALRSDYDECWRRYETFLARISRSAK